MSLTQKQETNKVMTLPEVSIPFKNTLYNLLPWESLLSGGIIYCGVITHHSGHKITLWSCAGGRLVHSSPLNLLCKQGTWRTLLKVNSTNNIFMAYMIVDYKCSSIQVTLMCSNRLKIHSKASTWRNCMLF